ncbi:MAG: GerMN domain-containing protein [Spirochaetes bacterium]|nr:GerMN domain-containing protein [Spirochaetota bacterium]
MATGRRRSRLGKTGCLFWLLILLIIVVIFIYKGKGNIREVFNFFKRGETKEAVEEIVKKSEDESTPEEGSQAQEGAEESGEETTTAAREREDKTDSGKTGTEGEDTKKSETGVKEDKSEAGVRDKLKTKEYKAVLYFVKINGQDGSVKPVPVTRTIKFKDSPITRTIESLITGPTVNERQSGITSFIPDETELISASIQNGHLTLNFSSKFEENYSGREAILLELSQVVLTSFNFTQVTKLSILIEGKRKRYITGEGIPLKEVYTKQDLSSLGLTG